MERLTNGLMYALLLGYSLAHGLAAAGLITFGIRAGGYPLNRWAIYGYTVAAVVALILIVREAQQRQERPSPLQVTLPPLLTLWVAGLYFTTASLRAEFAPYLDDEGQFAILNLLFALTGCGLALGYRWPRLLLTWAGGQGLLLLANPGLLSATLRYGARWDRQGLPLLLIPLAYGLSALALSYRVRLRRAAIWLAPFALLGAGATVAPVWRLLTESYRPMGINQAEMALLAAIHGLSTLYAVALVLGLPFHAWGVARTWEYRKNAPAPVPGCGKRPEDGPQSEFSDTLTWEPVRRDQGASGPVWPAFLALVYLASWGVQGWLTVGQALPSPGEVQGWVSQDHIVPDAYPGFMYWVPMLLVAVRWLLLPLAVMAAWGRWRRGVQLRLPARQFPALLAWPALASLVAFLTLIPPFVLTSVWADFGGSTGFLLAPLAIALGLLGLARLMETLTLPPSADADTPSPLPIFGRGEGAGGGVRALTGLMTVGLLLAYLSWQGQVMMVYTHFLISSPPVWAERPIYVPFDPRAVVMIGLLVHSGLALLGLWALWRTWWALARPTSPYAVPRIVWLRVGLAVTAAAVPLVGFWYWWSDPGIVETVPPQGATGVPRDTVIVVRFKPESPLREFWGTSQGMSVRYADTKESIPGRGGGWAGGVYHYTDGLLRPNAPVELRVHRQGRRSFALRFTTGGAGGPTATPMPDFPGPFGPIPLTPAPLPTSTLSPTPPPTMTPTACLEALTAPQQDVTPGEPVQVAFTKEGDVWRWREGGEAVRLTQFGDLRWLDVSDDGVVIAFLRGLDVSQTPELWAVNSDGSDARRLLSKDDLEALVHDDPYAVGASPRGLTWVPGTHTLAFDVMPIYDGLGAGPQDALRLIDADTGEQRLLIPPGQAGNFVYSPDSSQIALIDDTTISLVNADGTNRRDRLITYPAVGVGHASYRPWVRWAADSRSLRTVVPVTEHFAEVMTFAIWEVPADSSPPTQLGTVEASGFSVRPSPNLAYIAYWRPHQPRSNVRDLFLARGDGTGEVLRHSAHALEFLSWAPDSEHFVFWQFGKWVPQLGHTCGGFAPLTDTPAATELHWIDASRFLFVSAPGGGRLSHPREHRSWELRLSTVGGPSTVIARIEDHFPSYDIGKGGVRQR